MKRHKDINRVKEGSAGSALSRLIRKPPRSGSPISKRSQTIPTSLIGSPNEFILIPIPSTKAHFIDAYSKGKWNLSKVPCPPCLQSSGYMKPPECYSEPSRLNAVSRYKDLPHWSEPTLFRKTVSKLKKVFSVSGVSISLVDNFKCYFKVETMLDMNDVPRCVAIDSHALLSQGYFLLLDASSDWRTAMNPLVTGSPFIKFYCGVPLLTRNNEAIGILSIFDSFSKDEFTEESCKKLQLVSRDIMMTLDSSIEDVRSKIQQRNSPTFPINNLTNELTDLRKQLGRPTSSRSLLVFEKDGSGGPYTQNHNFRFFKYGNGTHVNEPKSPVDEKHLWNLLFSVGSLKSAATILAKVLATNYTFDFVYILEIRIAEPYQIPREYFPPNETKVEAESFRHASRMIKLKGTHDEFMTRVIGVHGKSHDLQYFENSIHYKAFMSEFGVEYKNPKKNSTLNHGILMPFYRHNSKIVRKSSEDRKMVDVYLRSGGYIIALFSENYNKEINPDVVSNIFNHASMYRKIYITA
ncbi:uncharacterized protein SPAPADRAFT_150679 [Spathaspora passalidarum NRRL Y-27907]|uniref:GAF domain-containing protein n=1 Tax=Spathaspora passalidarum (strain NRRL Y-27907 / 11-Y1) TaxID=619300 RepID=G3AL33_SPAPN|nr:uncharacterized protein SPAPADRAFT_150679 [Spathaspora passalidarum NRRL Y-27907]EGW33075.1 hypothetical protein SPAPADRAFT_150679 [Spathaspora passalidarum NRRL Y-27907]